MKRKEKKRIRKEKDKERKGVRRNGIPQSPVSGPGC